MAHASFENLKDLKVIFKDIRKLQDIKEKSAGVFYIKNKPFLHFHEKDNARWGHVKKKDTWIKINIPFRANNSQKKKFLNEIKEIHSSYS